MKPLLDENLPHQIRHELPGHDVFSVAYMRWSGIQNGALLRLAAAEHFDALVTNDQSMQYEQNQRSLPVAVVVLESAANNIESIRPLYPALMKVLTQLQPQSLVKVSIA